MYTIIPYEKFESDKLTFKKKKKKEKDYIKILYRLCDVLINDIYIQSPTLICKRIGKSFNTKIKNKYMIELECPADFIDFIKKIESNIKDYYVDNVFADNNFVSIIKGNTIKVYIYKDIYTGFATYNLKNNEIFDIDSIGINKKVNLILAFNYVWMNDYNYGLSWRIIGIDELLDV